ncbi:MAG: hypothetical protein ABSG44_07820 [Thermodesulfobacteriota bacterium]|jgi:hypothetical protein
MKALRVLIILPAFFVTIAVLPGRVRGSDLEAVPTTELETKFKEAEAILYDLLLPNTMARTQPRSKQQERGLLNQFERISAAFKKHPDASVRFLAAKVASTPSDDQDPAFCALQLLYEINTEASRKVIREAQNHPDEVVSRLAKGMVDESHDALWGFRNEKKDGT